MSSYSSDPVNPYIREIPKRRKPEDGKLNYKNNAASNQKLIQAVTKPYPGAF